MTREELDLLRERYRQIKLLYCGRMTGWDRSRLLGFMLACHSQSERLSLAIAAEEGTQESAFATQSDIAWYANHSLSPPSKAEIQALILSRFPLPPKIGS